MMNLRRAIILLCICLAGSLAGADTLELKNGSVIKGQYAGGTDTQISFRVGSSIQQYAVSDVLTLKFDSFIAPAPATSRPELLPRANQNDPPSPPPAAPVYSSSGRITVPMGTRLVVRTIDAID